MALVEREGARLASSRLLVPIAVSRSWETGFTSEIGEALHIPTQRKQTKAKANSELPALKNTFIIALALFLLHNVATDD